jgi:hypothetical protein
MATMSEHATMMCGQEEEGEEEEGEEEEECDVGHIEDSLAVN